MAQVPRECADLTSMMRIVLHQVREHGDRSARYALDARVPRATQASAVGGEIYGRRKLQPGLAGMFAGAVPEPACHQSWLISRFSAFVTAAARAE